MRHVAPHRWVEIASGKVRAAEADAMIAHAERCLRCARARDRVTAAREAFADIRAQAAPEVKWDRVRAQVYWQTSTQLRIERTRPRPDRASLAVPLASLAAVAALVAAVASGSVPRHAVALEPADAAPGAPTAAAEVGVLTMVRGDATVDGRAAAAAFGDVVGTASEIRTGSGEVSVQFGDGSAFAVGPRSVLRVREFDRHAIALEIDGRIDVDVAPRAPGQRFVVIAGSRTIEVRGTGFRVERAGDAVAVRCRHGRVAVKDDRGEVEVVGGEGVEVATGAAVAGSAVHELAPAELAELARSVPHRLAVWAAPTAMTSLTAALTIATPPGRGVRVDGTEVGPGPLTLRVVSSRHLVETEIDGSWLSAGWVDVRGGTMQVATADDARRVDRPEPGKDRGDGAARAVRRRQLSRQLDDVRACVRALHKQGIDDTYVQVEVSIDGRGAVRYANVLGTDLPPSMSRCVRDAVAAMRFPAGPAASWRETIRP